ncbi:MAG: hypothetical protein A3C07_02215 [Candidatus Sungbacteria bacterium RIFCSPHIGHO2_02_FULL_47_11]|uniref:Uncharacterized protein n=1 Tax=Candidatus Sungbacteria bacterium RIFCSPHIGHO2_02_FULL_47_11 TaxID=1802270 RepID=A0A1G2KQI0_9BACT|nr:MAG: hypothetical protein A3C07_02215 [Candidatus Sungbacteria bacterium RIFCSPHIGHO2_02_FULL_47_11]
MQRDRQKCPAHSRKQIGANFWRKEKERRPHDAISAPFGSESWLYPLCLWKLPRRHRYIPAMKMPMPRVIVIMITLTVGEELSIMMGETGSMNQIPRRVTKTPPICCLFISINI